MTNGKLSYKTVEKYISFEIPKIKGSKFIGHIFCVHSKEEAEEKLELIRKEHYKATHNCYAFRVGLNIHQDLFGNTLVESKYINASDDGEPGSTASHPMKKVLLGKWLENVLLVATRYYGGTKLGIWGLIQAYTDVSKAVIEKAKIIEVEITEKLEIDFVYDNTSQIMSYVGKNWIKILKQDYDEHTTLLLEVNKWLVEKIKEDIKLWIL